MSLHPRYSLLALLILTALIAGGVKLWYGPHHVVERPEPGWELEVTYTRNWRGDRIIDGPMIQRRMASGHWDIVYVRFFRRGVDSLWVYCGCVSTPKLPLLIDNTARCSLTEHERQIFDQSRDLELQRLEAAGLTCDYQIEGYYPIPCSPPNYQQ